MGQKKEKIIKLENKVSRDMLTRLSHTVLTFTKETSGKRTTSGCPSVGSRLAKGLLPAVG